MQDDDVVINAVFVVTVLPRIGHHPIKAAVSKLPKYGELGITTSAVLGWDKHISHAGHGKAAGDGKQLCLMR